MIPSLSISDSSQTCSCWLGARPRQLAFIFSNSQTTAAQSARSTYGVLILTVLIDGPKISLHPSCPDIVCTATVPKSP